MISPSSLKESFGSRRLLWQTRLGAYVLGLTESVPVSVVLSLDDGRDFAAMECSTGVRFLSYERTVNRRAAVDDYGTDLVLPAVRDEVMKLLGTLPREDWFAVSPYPSRALLDFASAAGIPCRCLDWDEFFRFSNKANLLGALAGMGLPRLPGRWLRLTGATYSELSSELGWKFVAQCSVGAAGSGTLFIESEQDYAAASARFADADVWVAPFAGPFSFNVNAIATERGTAVAYPSVQLVGLDQLRASPGQHCGNDFSATESVPSELVRQVMEQTVRIGDWMAAEGYRGLFGLDFVADEAVNAVYAVDLNPRMQGSTSLQAQAELRQERLPMAAAEIAYQAGILDARELMRMAPAWREPLAGSQLFPKNHAAGRWKARGALDPGVYTPGAEFLRPELQLCDLNDDEVLVNSATPIPGRTLDPHVTLARICSLGAAIDPTAGRAEPWVGPFLRQFYGALELEELV